MDSLNAIMMGIINRHKPMKVFDWDKAARLIRQHGPKEASAGLFEDWLWTGGLIYKDSEIIVDKYTYLASTWATPILRMDNIDYYCFIWDTDTDWKSETKWPQSAQNILG